MTSRRPRDRREGSVTQDSKGEAAKNDLIQQSRGNGHLCFLFACPPQPDCIVVGLRHS